MKLRTTLQRYWPETLLVLALALPWLSLLVLGTLWLWEHGHVWIWATASAVLALLAWPLMRLARRHNAAQLRDTLADRAEPSRAWNAREQEAWADVLVIADGAAPFSFAEITDVNPLLGKAGQVIEAVARRLHPEAPTPWAQFTVPEVLLLTERASRELRRQALRTIPGIRMVKLGRVLWLKQRAERYGPLWTVG